MLVCREGLKARVMSMSKRILLFLFFYGSGQHLLFAQASSKEALAVMVPGSGTYSRKISTDNQVSQEFFDQGLRLAWGFYFPESIASYQEAARLDPCLLYTSDAADD